MNTEELHGEESVNTSDVTETKELENKESVEHSKSSVIVEEWEKHFLKTISSTLNIQVLEPPSTLNKIILSEGTSLIPWRIMENVSSRILEFDEEDVVLELLVDKENGIYEEREFKRSLFKDIDMELGKFLKLVYYERKNQAMFEIKDTPGIVLEDDFPSPSFYKKYKHIPLKSKG